MKRQELETISKGFDCEIFDNFTISTLNCEQDKFLDDFENEFNFKYDLIFKDNIFLNDYQKQIFKNKNNDYILKINHISDNFKDDYYHISKNDFLLNDDFGNDIIIEVREFFDFDKNKINILNYSI